jgi:hypothetical protein
MTPGAQRRSLPIRQRQTDEAIALVGACRSHSYGVVGWQRMMLLC